MSACVRVSLSRDMNGFQSHGMWQGRHRSPWPKHDEEAVTGLPARPPAAQQVRGRGLTYYNPGTPICTNCKIPRSKTQRVVYGPSQR